MWCGQSVYFVDLHGLVDGQDGVANRGVCGRGGVAGRDGEIGAGAGDGIGVAFAFGAVHGQGAGGEQFVERRTTRVQRSVGTLGLGDLQQVHAHSSEIDRLGGRSALVGGGHLLEVKIVDPEGQGGSYDKTRKSSHGSSLALRDLCWQAETAERVH